MSAVARGVHPKSLEQASLLTEREPPRASTGGELGVSRSPSQLGGLGSIVNPLAGCGRSPGQKRIWCIQSIKEHFRLQGIVNKLNVLQAQDCNVPRNRAAQADSSIGYSKNQLGLKR